MDKNSLQDLCNIHHYLSQIKKPSAQMKKALASLEARICMIVMNIRTVPWPES